MAITGGPGCTRTLGFANETESEAGPADCSQRRPGGISVMLWAAASHTRRRARKGP